MSSLKVCFMLLTLLLVQVGFFRGGVFFILCTMHQKPGLALRALFFPGVKSFLPPPYFFRSSSGSLLLLLLVLLLLRPI